MLDKAKEITYRFLNTLWYEKEFPKKLIVSTLSEKEQQVLEEYVHTAIELAKKLDAILEEKTIHNEYLHATEWRRVVQIQGICRLLYTSTDRANFFRILDWLEENISELQKKFPNESEIFSKISVSLSKFQQQENLKKLQNHTSLWIENILDWKK